MLRDDRGRVPSQTGRCCVLGSGCAHGDVHGVGSDRSCELVERGDDAEPFVDRVDSEFVAAASRFRTNACRRITTPAVRSGTEA